MRYRSVQIPDWLEAKLNEMSPAPDFDTLFELVLLDYIKRNKPPHIDLTDDEYVARYASKIHPDGTRTWFNYDLNEWEVSTPGRLEALQRMRHGI